MAASSGLSARHQRNVILPATTAVSCGTPYPSPVPSHTLWSGPIQVLHSPPRDAITNMAIDEAMLAVAAQSGCTLLRVYSWDRPAVSFGRNQRCEGVYSAAQSESAGIPVVRRLTGGRALLHGREVTYSVAAPNSAAPTLRGGYDAINQLLLQALNSLGVPASLAAPKGRELPPGLAPCFEVPSAGELVVGSEKLVGSAQHRDATAFLQHGSILLDDDQLLLRDLALVPLPAAPPAATLRRWRPDADVDLVAQALIEALRCIATGDIVVCDDIVLPRAQVESAATRYRDPRWTWRR